MQQVKITVFVGIWSDDYGHRQVVGVYGSEEEAREDGKCSWTEEHELTLSVGATK